MKLFLDHQQKGFLTTWGSKWFRILCDEIVELQLVDLENIITSREHSEFSSSSFFLTTDPKILDKLGEKSFNSFLLTQTSLENLFVGIVQRFKLGLQTKWFRERLWLETKDMPFEIKVKLVNTFNRLFCSHPQIFFILKQFALYLIKCMTPNLLSKDVIDLIVQFGTEPTFGLDLKNILLNMVGGNAESDISIVLIDSCKAHQYSRFLRAIWSELATMLVYLLISQNNFKQAFENAQHFGLLGVFPDLEFLYQKDKVQRLVAKHKWQPALLCVRRFPVLQVFLVELLLQHFLVQGAVHTCNLFCLDIRSFRSNRQHENFLKLPTEQARVIIVDNIDNAHILQKVLSFSNSNQPTVGLDVEWQSSFYRQKRFQQVMMLQEDCRHVCEIASTLQIALKEVIFIIDLFKISRNEECASLINLVLSGLFQTSQAIKIGFGFANDLRILKQSWPKMTAFRSITSLIDLTKMHSSLNLLKQGGSLSDLSEQWLGQRLNKAETMSPWAQRPLTQAQIEYAALDAYCLVLIFEQINISKDSAPKSHKMQKEEGQNSKWYTSSFMTINPHGKKGFLKIKYQPPPCQTQDDPILTDSARHKTGVQLNKHKQNSTQKEWYNESINVLVPSQLLSSVKDLHRGGGSVKIADVASDKVEGSMEIASKCPGADHLLGTEGGKAFDCMSLASKSQSDKATKQQKMAEQKQGELCTTGPISQVESAPQAQEKIAVKEKILKESSAPANFQNGHSFLYTLSEQSPVDASNDFKNRTVTEKILRVDGLDKENGHKEKDQSNFRAKISAREADREILGEVEFEEGRARTWNATETPKNDSGSLYDCSGNHKKQEIKVSSHIKCDIFVDARQNQTLSGKNHADGSDASNTKPFFRKIQKNESSEESIGKGLKKNESSKESIGNGLRASDIKKSTGIETDAKSRSQQEMNAKEESNGNIFCAEMATRKHPFQLSSVGLENKEDEISLAVSYYFLFNMICPSS